MKNALLLPALLLLASGPLQSQPSASYPDFDRDQAQVALVVATVQPGDYFLAPPRPHDPNIVTIVLSRAFWFHAQVATVLHGQRGPGDRSGAIQVATGSHWGMDSIEAITGPALFPVLTHGQRHVMPKYAMAALAEGPQGQLFIPVTRRQMLSWLPCSVYSLKQEIDPQYMAAREVPQGHPDRVWVDRHPELYRSREGGAIPRFGIFVAAIAEHLATVTLRPRDLNCEAAKKW